MNSSAEQGAAYSPCKDCSDRVVGCHSYCIAYEYFTKGREKARQAESKERTRLRDIRQSIEKSTLSRRY